MIVRDPMKKPRAQCWFEWLPLGRHCLLLVLAGVLSGCGNDPNAKPLHEINEDKMQDIGKQMMGNNIPLRLTEGPCGIDIRPLSLAHGPARSRPTRPPSSRRGSTSSTPRSGLRLRGAPDG